MDGFYFKFIIVSLHNSLKLHRKQHTMQVLSLRRHVMPLQRADYVRKDSAYRHLPSLHSNLRFTILGHCGEWRCHIRMVDPYNFSSKRVTALSYFL